MKRSRQAASTAAELNRVKFGGKPLVVKEEDDWASGSDTESDVTELDEDASEPEYFPDAIKWARYRDSRKDRPDGFIGWHYGLMWGGYLKSFSDTEEFFSCFELDENGHNQMLTDFWNAVDRPLRKGKKGETLEPRGVIGEIIDPPKDLMKRWIRDARPRRSHKLFKIRIEKEWSIPRQKILKRDSDYYYHKRLLERAERERVRESELVSSTPSTQQGEAGPSTLAARAAQVTQEEGRSSMAGKAIVKGKEKEIKVKAEVDSALASLFEDDEIVAVKSPEETKKKKKGKNKDKEKGKDDVTSKGKMEPPTSLETGKGKGKEKEKEEKRKRESELATQTAGPSTHRTSPEKKAKIGDSSPKKMSLIPEVIPSPPAITSLPASITREPSPGPSRSAPSPTPPPQRARVGQEPLFLDSAASPADTFGEPMPGFFDSNPDSRGASQSLSSSLIKVKLEQADGDFTEPVVGTSVEDDDTAREEEEAINNALNLPEDEERKSKSNSPPPSNAESVSPNLATLAADVTGTSTSLVAAALAVISGKTPAPTVSRAVTPVAPHIDKPKSKSPVTAAESAVSPAIQRAPSPAVSRVSPVSPEPVVLVPDTAPGTNVPDLIKETVVTAGPEDEAVTEKPENKVVTDASLPARDSSTGGVPNSPVSPKLAAAPSAPKASETTKPSTIEAAPVPRASPIRDPSPPMEEPVPTFTSPRNVSRSPSLDMDISSSPIIPAEDAPQPDQATSPRYLLSPDKPPGSLLITQTKPPSPVRIKVPISERPKYVQPSRIQFLSDIVDPEAASRAAKKAAKNPPPPPPPPHAHPSLPDRPITSAAASAPIHLSRLALHEGSRAAISAPVQPPRGPASSSSSGPSGYGPRQTGPLADQKSSYKSVKPPWEKRNPTAKPSAGQSPLWNAPSGPSAMRTDQRRPAPHAPHDGQSPYLAHGAQSPAWAPNAPAPVMPYGAIPPIISGRSPMYGVQPSAPVSVDPRSGGASPAVSQKSPNPAMHAQAFPQAIGPRRRASDQPGQSPLHTPMSPVADSGSTGPRRIPQLGRITAHLQSPHIEGEDHRLSLNIMQGAYPGVMPAGDRVLDMVLNNKGRPTAVDVPMDEVDVSLVGWQMEYGARLVQWAKVGSAGGPAAEWEQFKLKAVQRGRAWVTFTENLASDNTVIEHFAVVMAPAKFVEPSIIGLGLGPWSTVSEIGIALLVVAIPLDTFPPPSLPNPVRPDLDIEEDKPKSNTLITQTHLFASYGLTPEYFRSLRKTRAVRYPGQEGHYDVLHHLTEYEFSVNEVIPYDELHAPENVLFMNNKFTRAVRSSTLDKTVNRRTKYFSAGPALHLLPSQWKLREIWATGGLVTFSPTFVLRHPDKVAEIMSMVRIAPNWAAYVTPQLVQWVNASWKMPARCPNPTQAYQTFTQSLFLDQHLLNLSGSPAGAGGGLAISTCPPLMSHNDRCARWLEWLQQVSTATDYQTLVDLCHDYVRSKGGSNKMVEMNDQDLELVDIEKKQIEDLTDMRKSPHLLPYRRYIYIGEVSLQREKKERFGAGVEFVDPESFAAIFSGAI